MSKIRNCCFTINNPKCIEKIKCFLKDCKYAIFGEEIGESGTPHLQGYAEWKNSKSFNAIRKGLENGHIETRKGTGKEAADYCKKDGKVWEHGEAPAEPGKRTDLNDTLTDIKSGMSLKDCIITGSVKNYQGIRMAEKLLEIMELPRTTKPKVRWYYGSTGTGKSYTAKKEAEEIGDVYYANANGKWFNGYDKHKCIIINDIRHDWKKFSDLLMFLDENPYRVETKGGMRQFLAEEIWITCPRHPRDEYRYCDEDLEQLTSRIDIIREFTGVNLRNGAEVNGAEVGGNTNPDEEEKFESLEDF